MEFYVLKISNYKINRNLPLSGILFKDGTWYPPQNSSIGSSPLSYLVAIVLVSYSSTSPKRSDVFSSKLINCYDC